ncbi:DUF6701 domain-containing protein [Vibrio splendidus]
MNILRLIAVSFLVLFSVVVSAKQNVCAIKGKDDFTVSFTVKASDEFQYVRLDKNENQPKEHLWYTQSEIDHPDYIFNEHELTSGHTYEVVITHQYSKEGNTDTHFSEYYLKQTLPTSSSWVRVGESDKSITNGDLYPSESSSVTITNIGCESIVNPPPIESPPVFYQDARFKFGQVPAGECYNGCTINFDDIEFRTTPIVFLMSSINRDKLSDDNPSAAFVQSVGTESATIVQKMPLGFDNNEFGMEPIFYLVAEPGYVQFDPRSNQKALVNTIDTQLYQKAGGGDTGWENVVFDSSFGNNETPIVLTQVQKLTQNDLWATSAIQTNSVSSSGFKAALELGRRNVFPSASQTIGYIAALPQTGTTENNEAFVFSAPSGTFRQPNSLSNSCNTNYLPLGDDFSSYGVILSKQSRTGGDGGWLRLCDLTKDDQFSFIFEEDYTDRKHGRPESVGFFAFAEPEPVDFDVCQYFPEPAQGWKGTVSDINIKGPNAKLSNWSTSYKALHTYNHSNYGDLLRLGFNTESAPLQLNANSICDGIGCDVGNDDNKLEQRKVDSPEGINYKNIVENSLVINAYNYQNVCSVYNSTGSQNASCSYQGENIYVHKDLTSLTINAWNKDFSVYLDGELQINYLELQGSATLNLTSNQKLTVGDFIVNGSDVVSIKYGDFARINVESSFGNTNLVKYIQAGSQAMLVLYGPEAEFYLKSSDKSYMYVLGRKVTMDNGMYIHGSVTSNNLIFQSGSEKIEKPNYSCGSTLPVVKYIEIKPSNHHLICEGSPQNEVQVHIFDEENKLIGGYQPKLLSGNSNLNITFLSESGGIAKYRVDNKFDEIGNFTLDASLVVDSVPINAEQKTISYVPYKFDIKPSDASSWEQQPISMTAGAGSEIDVRVLGCSGGSSAIVSNYSANLDNVNVEIKTSPVGGAGALTVSDMDFSGGSVTDVAVSFDNSGELTATIFDLGFDCSTQTDVDCPTYNGYLQGDFIIQARPWKIAVCDVLGENGETLSSPISGFVSSGKPFDVTYKPIIYSIGTQECSYPLATNYAEDSGPLSVVKDLVYPDPKTTSAILGTITPVTSEPTNFSPGSATLTVKYNWNEVGSLEFMTPPVTYLLSALEGEGSAVIGRFYPKYFLQGDPEWNVTDQNNIAYLDQPYDSSVHQVYPMASGEDDTDKALNNYRFFASGLQASFGVLDDTSVDNGFLLDTGAGTWSADRKHWLLNDNAAELQRVVDSDDVSRRDTPFNTSDANSTTTNFGLTIEGTDPVSFTDSDPVTSSVAFPIQPPARYGRMALDDIGGNSGSTLTIPLRAEFWDGSEFVINEGDDRSTFNSSNTCKQVIWHSEGATTTLASLSGIGNVDDGEEEVTASQNTLEDTGSPREQVRLWLRMDDSAPTANTGENLVVCSGSDQDQPWLRYNWRQLGDEDPSTVVTFGIYRGNDRVIYRGESGLTGQ